MRKLLALLILAAVTAPTLAGGYGGRRVGFRRAAYRGCGFRRLGLRSYDRGDPHAIHARVARFHEFFGHSGRPYWHHPYYLRRFGGFRPYQAYRMGYGHYGYGWGYGYRWRGGYNLYYPPAVAIAPIYSRLSVVLTLDDAVFDGPPADHDGLPRSRKGLVGQRFLVDLH